MVTMYQIHSLKEKIKISLTMTVAIGFPKIGLLENKTNSVKCLYINTFFSTSSCSFGYLWFLCVDIPYIRVYKNEYTLFLTVSLSSSNTSLASSYEHISSLHSLSILPGTTASKSQLFFKSLREINEPADFSSRNTEQHKRIQSIIKITTRHKHTFNHLLKQTEGTAQYIQRVINGS